MPYDSQRTRELLQRAAAVQFYDQRFAEGYMAEWPAETCQRIFDVVRSVGLPTTGEALDFGCGVGVLTDVIRLALPGWRVCGVDLSPRAIQVARTRVPDCSFFVADDPALAERKFDLLFTHHVLEHVLDLDATFGDMCSRLRLSSYMLHILPCGNPGSFEHKVCLLRRDGIDAAHGNRFFSDDEGHVRRLVTKQVCELSATYHYKLGRELYRNHYHGAIYWLTRSSTAAIRRYADPKLAVSPAARRHLRRIRAHLLLITMLRKMPGRVSAKLRQPHRTLKDLLLVLGGLPLGGIGKLVDTYYVVQAKREWRLRSGDPSGSEMCLFFERPGTRCGGAREPDKAI